MINEKNEIAIISDDYFLKNSYHDKENWDIPERLHAVISGFKNAIPDAVHIIPENNGILAAKLVHSNDYVKFVEEGTKLDKNYNPSPTYMVARKEAIFTAPVSFRGKHTLFFYDEYTVADHNSCKGAFLGVSCAYEAAKWILKNDLKVIRSAYVACRPPGHHAFANFGGGLCIFNNAAISASVLKEKGKVAIIDIDVDHGNGTQGIFYEDQDVFTASVHAEGWPYISGFEDEKGKGKAMGTNLNIVLPKGTSGDVYLKKLDYVIKRIEDYNPSYLVVALGFDAHKNDSYDSKFNLNASDFARISGKLKKLNLPTVFTQEGAYNFQSAFASSRAFFMEWIKNNS